MKRDRTAHLDVWPAFTDFVVSTMFILAIVIFALLFAMLVQAYVKRVQDGIRARTELNKMKQNQDTVRTELTKPKSQGGMGLSNNLIKDVGNVQHIVLPDGPDSGVMFGKGSAVLEPQGRNVLRVLAGILADHEDKFRSIEVEGHTDDEPICDSRYASNWELSAARAGAVVHYLLEDQASHAHRIKPWKITATGKAEFHPYEQNERLMNLETAFNPRGGPPLRYVAESNSTLDLQRKNRRIELQLIYADPSSRRQK